MNKKIDKLFVAMKAFILHEGKVLILEEAKGKESGTNPGKFEFPGGKMNPGEKPEEALVREVKEETGLDIKPIRPFHVLEWQPVVNGEQWQTVGIYFECKVMGDSKVKLSHEHESFQWIIPEDFEKYNLMKEPREAFKKYLEKQK